MPFYFNLLYNAMVNYLYAARLAKLAIAETTKAIIARTKTICAADIAVPAIPPNPSAAAMSATIRNVIAQPSMETSFSFVLSFV